MNNKIINEKILLDIFRISSASYKEEEMRKYIKDFLNKLNINYTEDKSGNIFNFTYVNKPVLSAHMDTVEDIKFKELLKYVNIREENGKSYIKGYHIIGGDDKCGIYIILMLLKNKYKFNFMFSIAEEKGSVGAAEIVKNNDFSNVTYGLVLDRRGNRDIICSQNDYGVKDFEKDLLELCNGKELGFSIQKGSLSDANNIRKKVSCANISVGYYNPHSGDEYVSLEDLEYSYLFIEKIISTLNKKYDVPKVIEYSSSNNNYYNSAGYCSYCYSYNNAKLIKIGQYNKMCLKCFEKTLKEIDIKDEEILKIFTNAGFIKVQPSLPLLSTAADNQEEEK